MPAAKAPLDGIRIIDLTRLLPGPLCTQYLADMGAEVIKIEHPNGGDYARAALDAAPDEPTTTSAFFQTVNRSKHSVTLDLSEAGQRTHLIDLVRDADVLVESFRPGVAARLGIGYPEMTAINPGLVYVSITGYGQSGVLRDKAGHDLNYIAYSGLLDQLRDREGEPVIPGFQIADVFGGSLHGVVSVLMGLVSRQQSGRGRYVDVSMTDCCKPLNIGPLTMTQGPASLLDGSFACYQIYRTSDHRHLTVGAGEPKFWHNLCAVLKRPDLEAHQFDVDRQPWLKGELAALFEEHTLEQWCAKLSEADCCFAPVLSVAEAMQDALPERHPEEVLSAGLKIGLPIGISNHAPDMDAVSPELGEHNSRYFGQADSPLTNRHERADRAADAAQTGDAA